MGTWASTDLCASVGPLCAQHYKRDTGTFCGPTGCHLGDTHPLKIYWLPSTIKRTRALIVDLLGATLEVETSIVELHSESAGSYYELSILKV